MASSPLRLMGGHLRGDVGISLEPLGTRSPCPWTEIVWNTGTPYFEQFLLALRFQEPFPKEKARKDALLPMDGVGGEAYSSVGTLTLNLGFQNTEPHV